MDYQKIDKKIEDHVTGLYEQMQTPKLVYHNLEHTKMVVKRTQEISGHYNVTEIEMMVLIAAAWFHDTGYLFTEPSKHEEMSCDIMRKFMKDQIKEETLIDEIANCIMVTKFPGKPINLTQKIICDADTYHFGTKDFKVTNKQIFEELKMRNEEVDLQEFKEGSLQLLMDHQFFTGYCKELLNAGKKKNMKKLSKKIKKIKKSDEAENTPSDFDDMEKDKSGLTTKGIQTMLRLTSENHLKLSDMADSKANILISVNAIIISVILSVLLRKLQQEPYLIIPTIIFLVISVATIVVSILATRPKINEGTFTEEEVKQKKINLLFFGNFYKATYDQYSSAMRELMFDTDYLYNSLIKDIYYLGVVLGRKYKLIRLAYNIFMIGIVVSVIAFAIATFFNSSSTSGTIINGTGSPFQ